MRWSLPFLLSLLPLGGIAGKPGSRQCKPKSMTTRAVIKPKYALQHMYKGNDFFSEYVVISLFPCRSHSTNCSDPLKGWTFYTKDDPTGGNVKYVSKAVAESKNLAYVRKKDGVVVLAVDSTTRLEVGNNMKRDS